MKKLAITNLIAEGTETEGVLKLKSSIRIDGLHKGDIFVDENHGLILGPKGIIEGSIVAGSLIVLGKVVGSINVTNLEIRSGGLVEGEMTYENLEVFSGGLMNGGTRNKLEVKK